MTDLLLPQPPVLEWDACTDIGQRPAWMDDAACRGTDPDVFHPKDGMGVLIAKRVCAECPVRGECLEFALATNEEHGVWGGCSERERRTIKRRRRQSVA